MSNQYNVAVVGATGVVGETLLSVFEEREFPVKQVFPLASERSAGSSVLFRGRPVSVGNLADFDFTQVDFAFFSAGGAVSAEFAPIAAAAGAIVIDNTSHFRYDADIPLVIPEVNASALVDYKNRNIIANPNCSTIQMLVALKPLHDAVGIKRINVCTYQAVSGAGKAAIGELLSQAGQLLNGKSVERAVFPQQIAFNVLPHIDSFQENGYTFEEMKMVWETQKILGDDSIAVNPTAVRVPVIYGHSEAIHIETKQAITAADAREILRHAPGVVVMDNREAAEYPTPMSQTGSEDAVYVGRIREDLSSATGLNLWVVADNVRKGAAVNAIQIAEVLIKEFMPSQSKVMV